MFCLWVVRDIYLMLLLLSSHSRAQDSWWILHRLVQRHSPTWSPSTPYYRKAHGYRWGSTATCQPQWTVNGLWWVTTHLFLCYLLNSVLIPSRGRPQLLPSHCVISWRSQASVLERYFSYHNCNAALGAKSDLSYIWPTSEMVAQCGFTNQKNPHLWNVFQKTVSLPFSLSNFYLSCLGCVHTLCIWEVVLLGVPDHLYQVKSVILS